MIDLDKVAAAIDETPNKIFLTLPMSAYATLQEKQGLIIDSSYPELEMLKGYRFGFDAGLAWYTKLITPHKTFEDFMPTYPRADYNITPMYAAIVNLDRPSFFIRLFAKSLHVNEPIKSQHDSSNSAYHHFS